MFEFAEPMRIQRNRYDNWVDNTDALTEAISRFNMFLEIPVIDLSMYAFSSTSQEDILASQFTPFLFDVIEFQFDELSSEEKTPFKMAINDSLKKEAIIN